MKSKLTNILILLPAVFLISCTDWLDITPSNVIVETEMFKEAEGYHNAINGLYKKMAAPNLYGRELTYGFVEVLSQNYLQKRQSWEEGINGYSPYYNLFNYQYTEAEETKKIIEAIWQESYAVIANANNIIRNIPSAEVSWFRYGQNEKDLILGEALAVRAMMHFDILRLFAPAPVLNDSKPYIPYVTKFPYYGGQPRQSAEKVMADLERDLLLAQKLVTAFDTLDESRRFDLSYHNRFSMELASNSQVFYEYRGYRLNAIAVTGLLARLYNYWGKHEEAFKYAKQVETFSVSGQPENLALVYSNDWETKNDRKFTKDLIFTLSDPLMFEHYAEYSASTGNTYLCINRDMVRFEDTPEADAGDNRFQYLCQVNDWSGNYIPLKFIKKEGSSEIIAKTADMIPLMRLSEMHLIMAEYEASKNNFSKANEYLNLIRAGRNCKTMDLNISDRESFLNQLFMEVRKEYFSEGPTFYWYKKYNQKLKEDMLEKDFIVPVPDNENIN